MISFPDAYKIIKNRPDFHHEFQYKGKMIFQVNLQALPKTKDLRFQLFAQSLEQISDIDNVERTSEGLSNLLNVLSDDPIFQLCFQEDFISYLTEIVINYHSIPPYIVYGLELLSVIVSINNEAATFLIENTPILDFCISKIPLHSSLLFLENIRNCSEDVLIYLREKNITRICFNLLKKFNSNSTISIYLLNYVSNTFDEIELTLSDYIFIAERIIPFCKSLKPTQFQSFCLDFVCDHLSYDMFKALVEIHFCDQFFLNYSHPAPTRKLPKCMDILLQISRIEGDSGNEGAAYLAENGAAFFISRAYSIFEEIKVQILDLATSIIRMNVPLLNEDFVDNLQLGDEDNPSKNQVSEMNFLSALITTGQSSYYDYALKFLSPSMILEVISTDNETAISYLLDAFISILQTQPSHEITKVMFSLLDDGDFHSELESISERCQDPEIVEKAELLLTREDEE